MAPDSVAMSTVSDVPSFAFEQPTSTGPLINTNLPSGTVGERVPAAPRVVTSEYVPDEDLTYTINEPGFSTSVSRGWHQLYGMGYGAAGLAADAVGFQAGKDWAFENYQRQNKLAARYPRAVESMYDINSVGDFGNWVVDVVGEQVPMLIGSLGASAVGGVAARTLGESMIKSAANKAITARSTELIAQGMTKDMAEAVAYKEIANTVGTQAGIVLGTTGMEAGSNWGQSAETFGLENTRPMVDLGMGFLGGMLELVGGESQLLRKITGKPTTPEVEAAFKSAFVRSAPTVLKGMAGEATTEFFQEIASGYNQAIQNGSYALTGQDVRNAWEAAIAGGLMGLGTGGATAFTESLRTKPKTVNSQEEEHQLNLIDTYNEKLNELDPYTQVSQREQIMYDEAVARDNEAKQQIDTEFDARRDQLKTEWKRLNSQIYDYQKGVSPRVREMPIEERQSRLKTAMRKQQEAVASYMRLKQNRDNAYKQRSKELEKRASAAGKEILSARRRSEIFQANRWKGLFEKDPEFHNQIKDMLGDAEQFKNRKLNEITDKIARYEAAITEYGEVLNPARNMDKTNPYMYQQAQKLTSRMQAEVQKLREQAFSVKETARKIATTAASSFDAAAIVDSIQNLYNLYDASSTLSNNNNTDFDIKQLVNEHQAEMLSTVVKALKDQGQALLAATGDADPAAKMIADQFDAEAKRIAANNSAQVEWINTNTGKGLYESGKYDASQRVDLEHETNMAAYKAKAAELDEVQRMRNWREAELAAPQAVAQRKYERAVKQYEQALKTNPSLIGAMTEQDFMDLVGPAPRPQDIQRFRQMQRQNEVAAERKRARMVENKKVNDARAAKAIARLTRLEKEIELAKSQESTRQTHAWIENTLLNLPGLIDNTVVCTSVTDAQVPNALQMAIVKQAFSSKTMPKGAYYNGKVYIFASEIKSKSQAVRTLIHEGVAHYGLRAIMSPRTFTSFMSAVYNDMSESQAWKSWAAQRPGVAELSPLVQAEEFIAWIAGKHNSAQLLNRMPTIRNIMDYIRKLFKKLFGLDGKVTEADILDVLSASAQNLAEGKSSAKFADRLTYATSIADATPEYTYVDISDVEASQVPYGWGLYFSTPRKIAQWYAKFNERASGVPGLTYKNYMPVVNQFMNWDTPLAEQPYIVEHVQPLLSDQFFDVRQNENSSVTLNVFGQDIGTFGSMEQLKQFASEPTNITKAVTGQNLYEWLASRFNDPKRASVTLRDMGIAGNRFPTPVLGQDNYNYVLFEGDDLSETFPPYASADIRFNVESSTPFTSLEDDYLTRRVQDTAEQQSWANKSQNIIKTGKSIGPMGQSLLHTTFERFIDFWSGERNKWVNAGDKSVMNPPTWFDRAVEYWHDSDRRIQIMQRFLKDVVGPHIITPVTNIYRNLTGMSNRVNSERCRLMKEYIQPMMEEFKKLDIPAVNVALNELKKRGVALTEDIIFDHKLAAVDSYLYARHAPERNAAVLKRMKGRTGHENPSGMSNEQAARIFEQYDSPEMRALADKVDTINRMRLYYMEKYKLLPKSVIDQLRDTYAYYVPLKNWDELVDSISPEAVQRRSRSGFSISGKKVAQKAKGRAEGDLPESPLVNSCMQLIDIIGIGEKNEVGRSLLQLVRDTSNLKDFWEIDGKPDKPEYKLVENGKTGMIEYKRKTTKLEGEGFKFVNVIDVNGAQVRIAVKDEALARAFRNENLSVTGELINHMRKFHQILGMLFTSKNPLFAIKNYPKDTITAALNIGDVIQSTKLEGLLGEDEEIRKRIIQDSLNLRMVKFMKKKFSDLPMATADDNYLNRMYDEFVKAGGHMRMFDAKDFKSMYIELRNMTRTKSKPAELLGKVMSYVDMLSDVSENATRFNVYLHLAEAFDKHLYQRAQREGWDKAKLDEMIAMGRQRATNEALEITVNFSRKGAGAPFFNALYMFSSATIGGNVRLLRNLWRKDSTTAENMKRVGVFMGAASLGAAAISLLCRSFMGDDDDGVNRYDKIPSYIRDANLIIPAIFGDGGYLKIPLPYGYNTFWTLGNVIDSVFHKRMKPGEGAIRIVKSMFDNFNPIGGSGTGSISAFVPTMFRPISQIFENKNAFGYEIRPESSVGKAEVPDSQKYWSTNPSFYRAVAETLNSWTFGSKVESGLIDVSPETLQHLVESYGGGVGRILTQALDIATSPYTGAPVEMKGIPLLSTFVGTVGYSDTLNVYSGIRNRVQIGLNEVDLANKDTSLTPAERQEIINKNRNILSLKTSYDGTVKQLNNLRKQERELERKYNSTGSAYYERKEAIKKQRERVMKTFIRSAERGGVPYYESE